jgi:hypothetical protein
MNEEMWFVHIEGMLDQRYLAYRDPEVAKANAEVYAKEHPGCDVYLCKLVPIAKCLMDEPQWTFFGPTKE